MKFDEQYFRSFYPNEWEYRWNRYKKEKRMFDIVLAITGIATIVVAVIWLLN